MQILKPANFIADALRGMCVISNSSSPDQVKQAESAQPNSLDAMSFQQNTLPQREASQWVEALKFYQSKDENLARGQAGVISVKDIKIPLSQIPDYSNLCGDKTATATVTGTYDFSQKRLDSHHGVPELHLVVTAPATTNPGKAAKSEYWAEEGYDGFNFVGSAYRVEIEDHATIQLETVAKNDHGLIYSYTRPFPG